MIYHHGETVSLSRRVPLLENMGFRVISERTFEASAGDARVFVHDMEIESEAGRAIDLTDEGELLESVFLATWNGRSENDAYAGLVQTARLGAAEIDVLRAYGRYLQQAGSRRARTSLQASSTVIPRSLAPFTGCSRPASTPRSKRTRQCSRVISRRRSAMHWTAFRTRR